MNVSLSKWQTTVNAIFRHLSLSVAIRDSLERVDENESSLQLQSCPIYTTTSFGTALLDLARGSKINGPPSPVYTRKFKTRTNKSSGRPTFLTPQTICQRYCFTRASKGLRNKHGGEEGRGYTISKCVALVYCLEERGKRQRVDYESEGLSPLLFMAMKRRRIELFQAILGYVNPTRTRDVWVRTRSLLGSPWQKHSSLMNNGMEILELPKPPLRSSWMRLAKSILGKTRLCEEWFPRSTDFLWPFTFRPGLPRIKHLATYLECHLLSFAFVSRRCAKL